ncbi:MAG TPA: hypothetical protein DCP57_07340 [Gammaproteobacteria bacterium]|nr:MAG: hypothetical protein CBC94_004605 [Gammaproteobacteria bacterium TMED134]HAL42243.1 hypothetical protein [Gammaproteobacteria bacterium]
MRRRFIAGAVCPSCRALDRMVVETSPTGPGSEDEVDAETVIRRCVACGYEEALATEPGSSSVGLPRARFEKSGREAEKASPVKLINLDQLKNPRKA